MKYNSYTHGQKTEFTHLQFSPQKNLTLWRCTIQIKPLIKHQLWFREQLSNRNHQRTDGQGPTVGELEKHNKYKAPFKYAPLLKKKSTEANIP